MFLLRKKHRDIIYFKAQTHLRSEASKTYLSISWWVLEPIIMMLIYYIVFDTLLERGTEDFVVFLLIGLASWQWFNNGINHGMNAIDGNSSLVNQIKFPKIILPSVNVVMDTFKFGIIFSLLCIFIWSYGIAPTENYIALIPLLITQYIMNCAITNIAALIPPFLPDIKIIISHVLRAGMFLSGVFYDYKSLAPKNHIYFEFNPMAQLIDAYRSILMYNTQPDYMTLGIIAGVSFLLLLVSYFMYYKLDPLLPRALLQR